MNSHPTAAPDWYPDTPVYPAIQRFLGVDAPPNKVQEVKNESYTNLQVLQRNEAMRLFAPNPNAPDKKLVYDIVLERPHVESINTSYR